MTWVQTYTGQAVDLLAPDAATIVLDDIAYSLAHQPRYNGHAGPYSVARHSVIVCTLAEMHGADTETIRWALLHDAAEAYTGDIIKPLKDLLRDVLRPIEAGLDAAIAKRFGVDLDAVDHTLVKACDRVALSSEAAALFPEADRPRSWGELAEEDLTATVVASVSAAMSDPARDRVDFLDRAGTWGLL